MASGKRWRQLGGGELIKFDTIGMEIEGVWEGHHDGKFGLMGTVRTEAGPVTFPLHIALVDKLPNIKPGIDMKIVYKGEEKSAKSGYRYKIFDVFIDETAEDPYIRRIAAGDQNPDADIPF